jgi:hypothetical protein
MIIELALGITQPPLTALVPSDDLPLIKLQRQRALIVGLITGALGLLAFAAKPLLGFLDRRGRPSGVRNCSGSSSPRASPYTSSSSASTRSASLRISNAICR